MRNKLALFQFLIAILVLSCGQNKNGTFKYEELQIDTSKINIFKWDTMLYTFPPNSDPLALTVGDIKLADSLLVDAVNQFNKIRAKQFYEAFNKRISIDSFTIDLSKYKRQYFPYEDNNGQRIIHVKSFLLPFPKWRLEVFYRSGHTGITVFDLRINLSDKKADELSTGSYG